MREQVDRGARIMVVDDEPANTRLLEQLLHKQGFEQLLLLNSSAQALDAFGAFEPDLVLLDLHMPPPDGLTVLDVLSERVDDDDFLPVLVLTADATEDAKLRALRAGATDFLAKPLQLTEVVLRIENLLHTRRLHEQVRRDRTRLALEVEALRAGEHAEAERLHRVTIRTQRVIDEGGLVMVFQPVVDLATGRVVGSEALARFAIEPGTSPEQWFVEAAEVGLGPALELHAIGQALDAVGTAYPADAFLSINASAATLCSPALLAAVRNHPDLDLVVELTEHERVHDYAPLTAAMHRLRSEGVRIAVDDTGSGYASLQHLLALEPDIVKLDRALIRDIDRNPVGRALAAALATFADATGIALVAEGIENERECDVLRSLGYGWGQGYALARPGPLPLAEELAVPTAATVPAGGEVF